MRLQSVENNCWRQRCKCLLFFHSDIGPMLNLDSTGLHAVSLTRHTSWLNGDGCPSKTNIIYFITISPYIWTSCPLIVLHNIFQIKIKSTKHAINCIWNLFYTVQVCTLPTGGKEGGDRMWLTNNNTADNN